MPNSNIPLHATSSDWELWEKLMNIGFPMKQTARDIAITQAVESFKNGVVDDPAYQADAIVEGVNTPIVASRRTTLECDVKVMPGANLHIGDLVECFGEKWIVVEQYTDQIGIINAKMWVCNDIIRFQNYAANDRVWSDLATNIITRYCIIDDGTYSRKSVDPIAYVPTNTYKLYVSMDSDTVKMYIDKRIAFRRIYSQDGTQVLEVYKIIGIDFKSKNFGEGSHLMVITMQRDVYNESTDDFDNMLCDYRADQDDMAHPSFMGSCIIDGRDVIRIGTARKYTAIFTDKYGEKMQGITPVWTIDVPTGVTQTVSQSGVVTIEVPFKESLIGEEITISLTDSNGAYGMFEKKVVVITVG